MDLNRTTLYDTHIAMGSRMVPFAGWEMPVQYTSPLEEHAAVRASAGLFDIDHMGQVIVEGPDALDYLQYVTPTELSNLQEWEATYSMLCYVDGGTVDDIFIYRLPEHYYVVVNASNLTKDLTWMKAHIPGFDVTVTDVSAPTHMLAFQGPKAQEVLQTLCDVDLSKVEFHFSTRGKVAGIDTLIGSTGYTGEYGFELFFDTTQAIKVWNAILEAGRPYDIKAIGLAARDSLRFEPCLPLYGHELSPDISPLEVGLGFFVNTDKGDFLGKEALLKQRLEGPARKLVCIEMVDKGVPREHYEVVIEGQRGHVTSGMFAPTLKSYAAMVLIPSSLAKVGRELEVLIRDQPKKAKIVKRPFYTPTYRK
ncbi:MAG: glycine cleavage system aminomethyltransferase GcvT [Anaerolineae bacterium]|nr:glycine cleavage system aminomethyltransferase GcvT [Anaerolineae bacterium]